MTDDPGQRAGEDPVVRRVLDLVGPDGWGAAGLLPLAWWHTRRAGKPVDERLDLEAKLQIAGYAVLDRAMRELAKALGAASVSAAFLKGADLNLRAYPEPGLRPMVDLDLLVADGDRPRATAVLEDLGYAGRDRAGDAPANTAFERDFVRARDGVYVDLHTAVDWQETLGVDTSDLLDRRVEVGEDRVPVLAAEDLLLNLATHALRDFREAAAKALVDAHYVIVHLRPDWPAVVERASAWRQRPALRLLLARLERLAGEAIPAEVKRALDTGWLARRIVDRLSASLAGPDAMGRDATERLARLGMIESSADRVRLLLRYGWLRLRGVRASR